MKKILFFIILINLNVSSLFAQITYTHHNIFYRSTHTLGKEVKHTFTDCKNDKLWCFTIIGTIIVNSLDTATTCKGISQGGFRENNFILPRHPSCKSLVTISTIATIGELTSVHALRNLITESCQRDALNLDSKWWKIKASNYNWKNCQYGSDLIIPIADWPIHSVIIKNNFDFITWKPSN